jgi:long-subunit acyl-CoA synthetase (AMP-forming)
MTECSIIASSTPAEPDDILTTDGSIFPGSEMKIIDDNGQDAATGVVGELLVRGQPSCWAITTVPMRPTLPTFPDSG